MKRVNINNKMYDVTDLEDFVSNNQLYESSMTAIERDGYVYPIVNRLEKDKVGMSIQGDIIAVYNEPKTDKEKEIYSKDKVIDFTNVSSMREIIEKSKMVKNMENEMLISSDNIFVPHISENDTPDMALLKEATIEKKIDINAYGFRFGKNKANKTRMFNQPNITMKGLKEIANALDMKVTLTIEDASDDIPNPIGKVLSAVITGENEDEE